MNTSLRPMQHKLRELGFQRAYGYRCKMYPDQSVQMYEQAFDGIRRKLEVQLWGDGSHRATHWHDHNTPYGVMDTTPSHFTTIAGMLVCIENEKTREHPKRNAKGNPVECSHKGYITFGSRNYPQPVDRGPYCPACRTLVEL